MEWNAELEGYYISICPDFTHLLRELVQHLKESLGGSETVLVHLDLDLVELDVSQAVPLGLIVNEAITNSMKYAFPSGREGNRISVALRQSEKNEIELDIADNGIGLLGSKKGNTGSLGLKLMKGLTEDMEGTFSIESENGVRIFVRFKANLPLQMLVEK